MRLLYGLVAQLVERRTENPYVGGSIPPQATTSSRQGAFCGQSPSATAALIAPVAPLPKKILRLFLGALKGKRYPRLLFPKNLSAKYFLGAVKRDVAFYAGRSSSQKNTSSFFGSPLGERYRLLRRSLLFPKNLSAKYFLGALKGKRIRASSSPKNTSSFFGSL